MKRPSPGMIMIVAALATAGVAYYAFDMLYSKPIAEARNRLAEANQSVDGLRDKLRDLKTVKKELAEFSKHTLGKAPDTVSHRYTAGLRTIAERCGLGRVVVTHRDPERVMNPLTKVSGVRPEAVRKLLRDKPDLLTISGTLTGQGTLEQVTKALAEVSDQPWCVVESVEIRPLNKEGERFGLELGVVAPLTPDLLASEGAEPELVKARPESGWATQAIVARNAFRVEQKVATAQKPTEVVQPAPPTAEQGTPQAAPPIPAPPPPYAEWKLTGLVVGSRTGVQAMMSNTRTNATVTVLRGAKVEDAVLVDGAGEAAVFEINGAKFKVQINQTLADRTPQIPVGGNL